MFLVLQLKRFGTAPLGLVLEGGIDSPLQYIFIKSIAFGSPAFHSGKFKKGDQLVMVGSECLIGMSLLQAKQVLEQAPVVVELVAQRKESVKQSPQLQPKADTSSGKEESKQRRKGRQERTDESNIAHEEDTRLAKSMAVSETQRDSSRPKFSRSTSHTDVRESGSISTSLAYATNLNASLNLPRTGNA